MRGGAGWHATGAIIDNGGIKVDIRRRDLLKTIGVAALSSLGCQGRPSLEAQVPGAFAPAGGVILNDIHSQLNETRVARVAAPTSLDGLVATVRAAQREGRKISVAGGRHAMGGQQFGTDSVHVDTRPLNRVLAFDRERGIIEVEAGLQWPELIEQYLAAQQGAVQQWGIAQKQTGADRLAIGGALSANAHGRGLTLRPISGDVESLTLVDYRGQLLTCSRSENPELFGLVIGGYGLFGVVYSVRLRLAPRRKVQRIVEVRGAEGLDAAFADRIGQGYLYGDFQFGTNEASPTFMTRGVFACYRPVDPGTPIPDTQKELGLEDWVDLLMLAHTDKARTYEMYTRYYQSTHGQVYWSDTQQLSIYPDDYHRLIDRRLAAQVPGSEMITEVYVPRDELPGFLKACASTLRDVQADVIYGTVRLIERDTDSFLAWAREPWACMVVNLHVDHNPAGIARAQHGFRALIDLARERGGTYYLTYHRWATREQVLACYPRLPEFLRLKRKYDPDERFMSDWYVHYRQMFA
jgi:FAD/FMN-containing dehydrogenase